MSEEWSFHAPCLQAVRALRQAIDPLRDLLFLGWALWVVGFSSMPCSARDYAATDLRGYGRVEGTSKQMPDGSILRIRCEDDAKAKLVQAKYLSDLGSLPGTERVEIPAGQVKVSAVKAPQGIVAAGRDGAEVFILAADSAETLTRLVADPWVGRSDTLRFNAEVAVPMFLDSWDQHGFRFYYRPWETPPDTKWADYDVLGEFDFAERLGHLGFVFWAKPDINDTGPGLTDKQWWDWAARAAERRDLPVVINTSAVSPTWLLNQERDQVMAKMPQFCGSFHSVANPSHDGLRKLSWCATTAKDTQLGIVQRLVREYAQHPNVIEYLEPHGELGHGDYSVFLEYGPVADANYRRWLERKYGNPATVARRWYGDSDRLQAWSDVRVPELASFLGWGPDAFDLTGTWGFAFEDSPEGAAAMASPAGMNAATVEAMWTDPEFDDSAWGRVVMPGDDRQMFQKKEPALLRRTFELPAAWHAKHARVWLYVWDLSRVKDRRVVAYVNGVQVADDPTRHARSHWMGVEVTDALEAGTNVVALNLPLGYLAYRVYLSPSPPRHYPALGEHRNAQWVDFSDWFRSTRVDMARRGIEMIRQVDPDRSIVCMAPDGYYGDVRKLCERYGAHFHNTGHMGGFWNDYLPALMRGADLPFSLEPGGPAKTLGGFKKQMGLYFTEGIQAIHYFIHVGNLMWPDDIRAYFESIQPLVNIIGKVHPPKAQVAMLLSDRVRALTGYPWGTDYNVNLPTGYWGWRISDAFAGEFHIDAVTDRDFVPAGHADPYRVIMDANTSVMDPSTVADIEAWVRRGGIFVTFVQTGRHTPEKPDSWPVSELTGYGVTHLDPQRADGREGATRFFTLVDGQPIFEPDDWPTNKHHYANGLSLEKRSPECRDLIRWKDGRVAAGLRPLGKGYVVHLGIKFGSGRGGVGGSNRQMLRRVLEWAEIPRVGAQAEGVMLRHYVSNNGLYDVWTLWNRDADKPVTTRLVFETPAPSRCIDVLTGALISPTASITVPPLETRIVLTPRRGIADAPLEWFNLQRQWWRGTTRPAETKLDVAVRTHTKDLTDGWAYRVLEDGSSEDGSPWAKPEQDDTEWPQRPLNCWAVGEELPSHHVFFRKTFTVPGDWQNGDLTLWLRSFFSSPVVGKARYWLDGQSIAAGDGRAGLILPIKSVPGAFHCLAVEIHGKGTVCGVRGNTWLDFLPAPEERLDLAGSWSPSPDLLRWDDPIELPGRVDPYRMVRRTVTLPESWTGGQVYLHMLTDHGMTGAIVNGRYSRRHHHNLGKITLLNITPLLRREGENTIQLTLPGGTTKRRIYGVELRLYE